MEKKLILVTSPPACGKTYVAKALAKNLKHVVYLDKDTLIVLSKQIFKVAGQPYDRSSAFFQQNIRDYEYDCVLALAIEALDYDDIVQLLCQRLGNIGLAAGGRRGYENEFFVHTDPSSMRKHLVLCEPSLL